MRNAGQSVVERGSRAERGRAGQEQSGLIVSLTPVLGFVASAFLSWSGTV